MYYRSMQGMLMIAEMLDAFSWKAFFLANDSQLRDDLIQLRVCCPYYLCSLMFFVLLQTYTYTFIVVYYYTYNYYECYDTMLRGKF